MFHGRSVNRDWKQPSERELWGSVEAVLTSCNCDFRPAQGKLTSSQISTE